MQAARLRHKWAQTGSCKRLLDSALEATYIAGAAGTVHRFEEPIRNEFTAVYEHDADWVIAYCPEVPGANGQGHTKEEARASLADAIALILEDRRDDGLRGVPADAEREVIIVDTRAA